VKRTVFLLFLLFSAKLTFATHIVGGEFELIHLNDYNYKLNLILYFDIVNGSKGAEDPGALVYIFRKSDDQLMQTIALPQIDSTGVDYSVVECSDSRLITAKLLYSQDIYLSPGTYNDPEGYYVVWERCCRNNIINNIVAPWDAGQTFILEFPPVFKDGKQFVNSSPVLFPPLRDYASAGYSYWADFAGQDPDGDSLAYTLVTPYSTPGGGANPVPEPTPPPYPLVEWVPGITLDNVVPGTPPLRVDRDGLVTVTPSETGLYVFSVLVEEFRSGEKIGEVRRDFQMLVIDRPVEGIPPNLLVKTPGSNTFTDSPPLITFAQNDSKCLQFVVTDEDRPIDGSKEGIRFRVKPVNFYGDVSSILSIKKGYLGANDSLYLDVCFPDCPFRQDQPAIIDIIAFDNTCPQGLSDTVRIAVDVQIPPNADPYFTVGDVTHEAIEGNGFQYHIEGIDPDKDSLQITVFTDDFIPENYGMNFSDFIFDKNTGTISGDFSWETGCDVYDFTQRQDFPIALLLNDYDMCLFGKPDTLHLNLKVKLPTNNDPEISTDLPELELTKVMGSSLNFNVSATDVDGDVVILKGKGLGFTLSEYNMQFPGDSAVSNVSSAFSWNIECAEKYLVKDEFDLLFWVNDKDKCKFPNYDSLKVKVHVVPPPNEKPVMSFADVNNNLVVNGNTVEVQIGQTIDLSILGNDFNGDLMNLQMYNPPAGLKGYSFASASGKGTVSSDLIWAPQCENLSDEYLPNTYTFHFLVQEDRCVLSQGDSLEVIVKIKDLEVTHNEFIPPNVFTPNGDGINDVFSLASLDLPIDQRLPEDNCAIQFKSIRIYNRWGKEVFTDYRREFSWDGGKNPAGVYYYVIEYTHTQYKGVVSILN